jgi:hypothetical protein
MRKGVGAHGIAWCRAESGDTRSNLEDVLGAEYLKQGGLRTPGMNVNPDWADWFMGYPIGHTALKEPATPSSRKSRKTSSAGSLKSSAAK